MFAGYIVSYSRVFSNAYGLGVGEDFLITGIGR